MAYGGSGRMSIKELIDLLMQAPNFQAPAKYIDNEGKEREIKNIYIDRSGVVLEGETV